MIAPLLLPNPSAALGSLEAAGLARAPWIARWRWRRDRDPATDTLHADRCEALRQANVEDCGLVQRLPWPAVIDETRPSNIRCCRWTCCACSTCSPD